MFSLLFYRAEIVFVRFKVFGWVYLSKDVVSFCFKHHLHDILLTPIETKWNGEDSVNLVNIIMEVFACVKHNAKTVEHCRFIYEWVEMFHFGKICAANLFFILTHSWDIDLSKLLKKQPIHRKLWKFKSLTSVQKAALQCYPLIF